MTAPAKFRATFTQRGDDAVGTVEWHGGVPFALECVALVIEQIAKSTGVPPLEVIRDLNSIVHGKVT